MYDLFSIQPVIDLRMSIPLFGFTMLICYAVNESIRMKKERLVESRYGEFVDASRNTIATVVINSCKKGMIDNKRSVRLMGSILKFEWDVK